jgi:hypothetical protein
MSADDIASGETRLFMAVTARYARRVHQTGFVGQPETMYDSDKLDAGEYVETGPQEFCEFRDMPPAGLTFSLTAETHAKVDDEGNLAVEIGGGPVLADDMGDFVLSIRLPSEEIREHEVHEDPPQGWPFRE